MAGWRDIVQRIDPYRWEIPVTYKAGMRVPARIYASEELLETAAQEQASASAQAAVDEASEAAADAIDQGAKSLSDQLP